MQALVTDLGFDVLFKGTNFTRLLGGMWVTLKISLISVALSIVLGILLGVVMTFKNPVTKAICRVYLEIVRIMPQLVLLFIVYYGSARLIGQHTAKYRTNMTKNNPNAALGDATRFASMI